MSISLSVIGIVPADEKFKEMKTIYEMCEKNNIRIPDEVDDYFGDNVPDDLGMEVDIPCEEYKDEYSEGYKIDVSKIPKKVKFIKCVMR
jgi:hypothetical protein